MSAAREPDQADFDLERFIDMFDTAMTSDDPRVVETLRKLMMIVTLTRPETSAGERQGPLRRLFEDMNHLNRRMHRMEDDMNAFNRTARQGHETYGWDPEDKYKLANAAKIAAQINQDAMRQLSKETATAINGGQIKGLK